MPKTTRPRALSLLIATATVGYFLNEIRYDDKDKSPKPYDLGFYGRLDFFLFATSVGMIIVVATFCVFITGLQEKFNCAQTMVTTHAIWTLQLLVSSALVAKSANALDSKPDGFGRISICDTYDVQNTNYQCSNLTAGVVFGFIAMWLFLLDTGIYAVTSITFVQRLLPQQLANAVSNSTVANSNN